LAQQAERGHEEREEPRERRIRELSELLQELRVILPGVQVLFAFLLTVPFSARFTELTRFEHYLYFGVLLFVTGATGFLTAPSAHHRVLWRRSLGEKRLRQGNRFAILGLVLLAISLAGAVVLISGLLFGYLVGTVACALGAAFLAWIWFGIPLLRGIRAGGFSRDIRPEHRR